MSSPTPIVSRLERATASPTGIRFVGASVAGPDGDFLSWAQLHEEARAVGAALQARGIAPGDHVAILGPTSRALVTAIQGCWLAGAASMVLPLPMRMGSLEEFVESTRARIRHGDAKLLLIDDQLAAFYEPVPGDPPIAPARRRCCRAAATPAPDALEIPPHDPERLVILQYTSGSTSEPKGVMIPDRVLRRQPRRHQPRRPSSTLRRRHGVVAAALPRHGPGRLLGIPMTDRRRPRAGRAAGLPRPSRPLDGVALDVRRHGHRGPELRLGAGHPGAAAAVRARPLAACASRSTAPSPSTPTPSRRSSPRPRAFGFRPGAVFPAFGMAEVAIAGSFPKPLRGLVCDAVDRRGARARALRQARRDQRPGRRGALVRRLPLLGKAGAGAGVPHRRPRHAARTCPSATSASSSSGARR